MFSWCLSSPMALTPFVPPVLRVSLIPEGRDLMESCPLQLSVLRIMRHILHYIYIYMQIAALPFHLGAFGMSPECSRKEVMLQIISPTRQNSHFWNLKTLICQLKESFKDNISFWLLFFFEIRHKKRLDHCVLVTPKRDGQFCLTCALRFIYPPFTPPRPSSPVFPSTTTLFLFFIKKQTGF